MSTPVATYRLQLHKDFTLNDAADIVPYLHNLGISHLYLSPVLESAAGSNHGYDGTNFTKISSERGGEQAFARLDRVLNKAGLKSILDIVPNHMGIAGDNPFWNDVLKHGPASEHWPLFDIRTKGKIRLPLLGNSLEQSITEGAVSLTKSANGERGVDVNGRFLPFHPDTPKGDDIAELLKHQHYQIIPFSELTAIDYRRFFHIFELIGVRVEDHEVYDITHAKLKEMAGTYASIDGVRVDHIDGLYDPTSYLQRLQSDFPSIWVEKILTGPENLPASWPVEGTTGYEFIPHMNQLFVDAENYGQIETYWKTNIQGQWHNFKECVADSKEEILHTLFPSELERLVTLTAIKGKPKDKARTFWAGITASMLAYRTYATDHEFNIEDSHQVWKASQSARKRYGEKYAMSEVLFLPGLLHPVTAEERQARLEWQQLTGPVIAKGLEDTAHYRYNPLSAFNEVGCEPVERSVSDRKVFDKINERTKLNPNALNATSTHDTKRSEDARHRLYALADRPDAWLSFYEHASSINKNYSHDADTRWLDQPTEYFYYQALIGSWPINGVVTPEYKKRLQDYMHKASKEGSTITSWANPDTEYDNKLQSFISSTLDDRRFLTAMNDYIEPVMKAGAINSLAVQTLKILGPGIPDIYQGTEGWDFSLVDPDNRRPVDYQRLVSSLTELDAIEQKDGRGALLGNLTESWKSGAIKQWLTRELLAVRREAIAEYKNLSVHKIETEGKKSKHVLAYTVRSGKKPLLAVAVARHPSALLATEFNSLSIPGENWADTSFTLPHTKGEWIETLRRKPISNDQGFVDMKEWSEFPVAVFQPV